MRGEFMEIKIIKNDDDFKTLEDFWKKLENQSREISVYSTYEFNKTWWNVYKKDKDNSLFLIYVFEGDNILGIAPLYIKNRKKGFLNWRELHFIGQGDYLNFIVDEGKNQAVIKTLMDAIYDNKKYWDRIILPYISANTKLAHYLLKDDRYNKLTEYLVETPYIDLEEYQDIKDIQLPSKTTKYRNKLNREVGYKFKIITDIDDNIYKKITDLHKNQQEFLRKEANRKNRKSLFDDKLNNEYVDNLRKISENTMLFLLLDKKGDIICYRNTYKFKDTIYSWNTAYNIKYIDYRVNGTIYYEIFNYIIENKLVSKFDFGSGRYPWKFRWTEKFVLTYKYEDWNLEDNRVRMVKKLMDIRKK